jgi:Domain of unknown function (DUF1911)/Domain of unknown function (DUF1910)
MDQPGVEKRDPQMDQAYFDRRVQAELEGIAKSEARLEQPSKGTAEDRATYAYSIFRRRYQYLILRYSRGENIAAMAEDFPPVIDSWERYLKMEGHQETSLEGDINDYVCALWLISLAIIFAAKKEVLERLLSCVGPPGQDALLERLVATRVANRRPAAGLLHPKPYEALFEAIDAGPKEQEKLFKKFLKAWYPAMGSLDAYWHNNHKGPAGGGYFGYWCVEAAGAVVAFKIDDRQFRDMPYYPKDLAGYGLKVQAGG